MKSKYMVFSIQDRHYAFPADKVLRVFRRVEILPVPNPPPHVSGMVIIEENPVPVLDLHKILGLPEGEMKLSDHMALIRFQNETAVVVVEEVKGIEENVSQPLPEKGNKNKESCVRGMLKANSSNALILDLDPLVQVE